MIAKRYTMPAIVLHWIQAALIVWLLWLGWTMVDLPKGAPARSAAFNLHKSLGLVVLLLAFVRVGWRHSNAPPPSGMVGWEERVARFTHGFLYAFVFIAPIAGFVGSTFTKYGVKFFGIELPRFWAENEALVAVFREIHEGAVWAGAALIALHIAGALRHGFGEGSAIARMLPWGRSS